MSELVQAPKSQPVAQNLVRTPIPGRDLGTVDRGRELTASLAAREPGPQPSPSGAAVTGAGFFKSADPTLDGQPASVISAQLRGLIDTYDIVSGNGIERARAGIEQIAHLGADSVLGDVVGALTPGEAPSVAPWLGLLQQWKRARALVVAARSASSACEGLKLRASLSHHTLALTTLLVIFAACGPDPGAKARTDQTRLRVDIVAMAMDQHLIKEHRYPSDLGELVRTGLITERDLGDAWGRGLELRPVGERRIALCSAGPDGAFATGDDICREKRTLSR